MVQTLEQVNAVRKRLNQEPLTELPGANAAEKLEAKPEGEGLKPENKDDKPKTEIVLPELTDEQVMEYLQKKKGFTVNSFEDLNKPVTEADIQKQAEQRENNKLSYGLDKGLFNRKTHEQFIIERSNKKDLVFSQYYQDAKKEDPELSDEDIQTEFAAKYGLDAEPNTRKYKRGEQEIEILGDIILRNKYSNIYKLDSEYDTYETTSKQQQAVEQKIKLGAPIYKKDVEDIFSELKKVTTKFSDTESYDVELLDDAVSNLKEKFFDKNFVAQKISQGYTKEELKQIAFTALISENFPVIAQEIVKQALHKAQKGVKGILPVGPQVKADEGEQKTEQQKAILNRLFPNQVPVAN